MSVVADCYQDISARVESGDLPALAEATSAEEALSIYKEELERCTALSGTALLLNIVDNYCALKMGKQGDALEKSFTRRLLIVFDLSQPEYLEALLIQWDSATGEKKDILFSILGERDSQAYSPFEVNLSLYKSILEEEGDEGTPFSMVIIDYMFARSPGLALFMFNSEIENLKETIKKISYIHYYGYTSGVWSDEYIQIAKTTLDIIRNSNCKYKDIFIAEMVNKIPVLQTEEVNTFLEQSSHPLVLKRIQISE